MDTIRAVSHGITLTVDTMTSSILSARGTCIVCNSNSGVVFMSASPGGDDNVITVPVDIATNNKGVVQRMWHGLMSSRLSYLINGVK